MAFFKLQFDCDNDAFAEDGHTEIIRILQEAAKYIEDNGLPYKCKSIKDINGNNVGQFVFTPDGTY